MANLQELLRERFPDKKFETDEDTINAFNEMGNDYDDLKKYKTQSEENSKIFADALDDDEVLAMVISDVHKGIPFKVAIAKYLSPEDLVVIKEDENYPAYEEAMKEREGRLSEKRKREKEIEDTMSMIDEYGKETYGEDEEGKKSFVNLLEKFARGNITKDDLALLRKGSIYDKDIESARKEAEIKGKNANIIESKKELKGDDLPNLSATSVVINPEKPKKRDMFDEALEESKRKV